MSSMDMLDVGQANEFKLACRRNNFTPEDLKWLCEGSTLAKVRSVRAGQSSITAIKHVIDYGRDPTIPLHWWNWTVEEHRRGGPWKWSAKRVSLHLSQTQQGHGVPQGHLLRRELALEGKSLLNANVLDHLIRNPYLIPKECEGKNVIFWGTIYRSPDGRLHVRYLCKIAGKWVSSSRSLEDSFDPDCPAMVRTG